MVSTDKPKFKKSMTIKGVNIPYYTNQQLKKMYPKGGCVLVGAIGKDLIGQRGVLETDQGEVPYYANHYPDATHKVVGYAPCGSDQYLVMVVHSWLRWLILALLLLILFTALVLWVKSPAESATEINPLFDQAASDYNPTFYVDQVEDENHIAIPGYSEIPMYADTDQMRVALWNPAGNPCLFQFSIVMGDEVLYESGLVEPGTAVQSQTLNRTIPEGTYDATIKIRCYDLVDMEQEMNGGAVNVKIIASPIERE